MAESVFFCDGSSQKQAKKKKNKLCHACELNNSNCVFNSQISDVGGLLRDSLPEAPNGTSYLTVKLQLFT